MQPQLWIPVAAAGLLIATYPLPTAAAYFQLTEQSTADLGRAHAGAAAAADDASAVWYNSAGLTQLTAEEIIGGYNLQRWYATFTKSTATDINGRPLSGGNPGEIGKAGGPFFLYYAKPLTEKFVFGLGLNEPFGYSTNYRVDSVLRYQAVYSSLSIVNLNAALAYRINDEFSVGAGLNAQRVYVKRNFALDFGALCLQQFGAAVCSAEGLTPQNHDGFFSSQLDGSGYGTNLGVLWNLSSGTRLGLSYRSRVKHTLDGNASFANVPDGLAAQSRFQDQGASSALTTPQIVSLSLWHGVSERLSLGADWSYTGWGSVDRTNLHFANSGVPDMTLKDGLAYSYRYSFGCEYRANDAWTWRSGISVDNSPVPDEKFHNGAPLSTQTNAVVAGRTAGLPDDDRRWLAVGASWQASGRSRWDLAYAHLFMNAHIPFRQTDAISMDQVSGQYNEHIDIIGLSYHYRY